MRNGLQRRNFQPLASHQDRLLLPYCKSVLLQVVYRVNDNPNLEQPNGLHRVDIYSLLLPHVHYIPDDRVLLTLCESSRSLDLLSSRMHSLQPDLLFYLLLAIQESDSPNLMFQEPSFHVSGPFPPHFFPYSPITHWILLPANLLIHPTRCRLQLLPPLKEQKP